MRWKVQGNWDLFEKNNNKSNNSIWNCHQTNVTDKWLFNFINDLKWLNSQLNAADNHIEMMKNYIYLN